MFIPVVFLMGVPWSECELVASLVSIKTVINEFVGYQKLSVLIEQGKEVQRWLLAVLG